MKNTFLKSTLILLIGGCLTKIIGLAIRIIYTRILKDDGIALHSLIMPTYSLLMTLANFNIQTSISKQISSKHSSKKVLINASYIMFFLNVFLIVLMFLFAKFISNDLLRNEQTFYPLLACALTLPFISIGYIIKGYFYGKQNMAPHMISNVLEQLFRLLVVSFVLPRVSVYGIVITVTVLILISILTESFSIFVLMLFLPRKFKIKKEDLNFNKEETKGILSITVPSIGGRLIGNIGYFFEPIILTNLLLSQGFTASFIAKEYGVYNAYAVSTLLFPSFFIMAISNALLPEISRMNSEKNVKAIHKRVREALIISVGVGIICTGFIFFFKEPILHILYNTNQGMDYINILAPFFVLYYLEAPVSTILIGLNKVKICSFISVSGIFIKLGTLTLFGALGFGIYALVFSEIIDILYVTLFELVVLKKELKILR